MPEEIETPEPIVNDVVVKGEVFELETKDKALVLAIQELTNMINRLVTRLR